MASSDGQPAENHPNQAAAGDVPAAAPRADEAAGGQTAAEQREPTLGEHEPPIFGGVNPPVAEWYHNPDAEAVNLARKEAEEEQTEQPEASQEGLDEEFLSNRRRRQELLSHLFSPFYILPLFVLALLIGISTVNISTPESATVRATVDFVNFDKLNAAEQIEFQLEQDRVLKSDELRAMTRGILEQGPVTIDPGFVTDTLEFHRALDRSWTPDGRLVITTQSTQPELDAVRLRVMIEAYALIGQHRTQDIQAYEAAARALEDKQAADEKESVSLRTQIDELAPVAMEQSSLNDSVLSTEQYLSHLAEGAPERVVVQHNLDVARDRAKAAREAGENRDRLIQQRIELIQQIGQTRDQIIQKRAQAGRVVYPKALSPANFTVSDLRPASYGLLWVVTVVICGVFAALIAVAYLRNLRREALRLGRATADTTAPASALSRHE